MDVETVVKIEGYSVNYLEKNDNGQAQSDEIKSAVSIPLETLSPRPCGFHNYDSTSLTAIAFHPEIGLASNCKQVNNLTELQVEKTQYGQAVSGKKETFTQEKFKCSIPNCSKSFAIKRKLNVHLKYEHRQNWFKCQFCGSSFSENLVFKNHLLATHFNRQPYACNMCSKSFKYIECLRKHEREIHQITQETTQKTRSENQSPIQNFESAKIVLQEPAATPLLIPAKISLPVSFKEVLPEDVALCSKSPPEKRSELVNHESDPIKQPEIVKTDKREDDAHALAEEKYKCSISNCSKSFSNKSRLKAHLTVKHGQNWLYRCHLCGKMCSTKSMLKQHLVSHSTERPHNCKVCSKSFKCIGAVKIHEENVHLISSSSTEKRELVKLEPDLLLKKIQPQISITTTTTLSLQDSKSKIEAELVDLTTAPKAPLLKFNLKNKCDVCFKDFKSHDSLVNHKRHVHTAENEKGYKCYICPKSFAVRPRLKNHLYFVHGEKSEDLKIFECEFCGRKFRCVSNLEAHIVAMHVVDKEFECSVCSKTFIDQDALTKHQVKIHEHTTISHFCDVCLAGFTSRRNLAGHVKNFHKILFCYKCGRSFENKSKFNLHINSEATINLQAKLQLKCQVCSVTLSTQCNFNIHTDGHSREKEFA